MIRLDYPIVIEPAPEEEGGGYRARVPDLPGCISDGETRQEAVSNIQQAIMAWLAEARNLGWSVPSA
ncbi:type II toxin-antitoxin system HicB family antitoxin [Labrys monachus]|uniref:RNase H-like HicB family nuclease n=1 Tax=Labrys monachus TaxID=217067 RepID=A0ABU0FNG8_9HYPH|nr:type II toxin-antitoxin system HicB family antitoxin [Labrys monachus]MDQ0396016.1 putative RNase H-like HicB family nuclease [Labrys monachus]